MSGRKPDKELTTINTMPEDRRKAIMAGWEDKRIYCVVATTVQRPTGLSTCVENGMWSLRQPAGRLAAQAAHAVSKARMAMLKHWVQPPNGIHPSYLNSEDCETYWESMMQPITTISLGARDSFELIHVANLLEHDKIPVHKFIDSNQPDYGDMGISIMTAIATEPVKSEDIDGILDYLPLWSPE